MELTPVVNHTPQSAQEHSAHIQKQIQTAAFGLEFYKPQKSTTTLLQKIKDMQDEPSLRADWASVEEEHPGSNIETKAHALACRLCGEIPPGPMHKAQDKDRDPGVQTGKAELMQSLQALAKDPEFHRGSPGLPVSLPQELLDTRAGLPSSTTADTVAEQFKQEVQRFKDNFPSWNALRGKHCIYRLEAPEAGFDAAKPLAFKSTAFTHNSYIGHALTPVNVDPAIVAGYTQRELKVSSLVLENIHQSPGLAAGHPKNSLLGKIQTMLQTQDPEWQQVVTQSKHALGIYFPNKSSIEMALRWLIDEVPPTSVENAANNTPAPETWNKIFSKQARLRVDEAKQCLSYVLNNEKRHALAGALQPRAAFQQFTAQIDTRAKQEKFVFSQTYPSWYQIRARNMPFLIENTWENANPPFDSEAPCDLQPTFVKNMGIALSPVRGPFTDPEEKSTYTQAKLRDVLLALEFSAPERDKDPSKKALFQKVRTLFDPNIPAPHDLIDDIHATQKDFRKTYASREIHTSSPELIDEAALHLLQKIADQIPVPAPGALLSAHWIQRRDETLRAICRPRTHAQEPGPGKDAIKTLLTIYMHDTAQHQKLGPLDMVPRPALAPRVEKTTAAIPSTSRAAPTVHVPLTAQNRSRTPSPPPLPSNRSRTPSPSISPGR